MDSIRLLMWDVSELIRLFTWRDLTSYAPFFWMTIFYFIPLKNIDARHEVTFFLFTVVFVSFGLTIFVPLYYTYETAERSPIQVCIIAIILMLIAFYKWARMIPAITFSKKDSKK